MRIRLSCINEDECGFVDWVREPDIPKRLLCPYCFLNMLVDYNPQDNDDEYEYDFDIEFEE